MDRKRLTRAATIVGTLAWMAVIFGFSSLPGSAVPGKYGSLAHFCEYGILAVLYALALPDGFSWRRRTMAAVAMASLYGVTDEFHQSFVPGRVPDVVDWMVDTAGAITAVGALSALGALLARRRSLKDQDG